MKVVATKPFTYAGRRIGAGELFETKTDRDAKLLLGVRSVRIIEDCATNRFPAPKKSLIEKASGKFNPVELKVEEVEVIKEDTKLDDKEVIESFKSEEEIEESKIEELSIVEDSKEDSKPNEVVNTPKTRTRRNYSRKK